VPDDLVLPPWPALAEAQRLLDTGFPFHAHEILEGTWKTAPAPERDLWQGLAQLCVGLTHVLRGNLTGASTLLSRGRSRLANYVDDPPYDVDVAGLLTWSDDLVEALVSRNEPGKVAASPPVLQRSGRQGQSGIEGNPAV
jgi:predicted metal-dependent hydrolase